MKRLLILIGCSFFASNITAACNPENPTAFVDVDYYAGTNGLTGPALKTKLNTIIDEHKVFSYTPCVWEILKEADEAPSDSDSVLTFYSQKVIAKTDQDDGSNKPDDWNREHVWAKSHGFKKRSQDAYTDVHHLRAEDRSVNTDRSHNDFAMGGEPVDDCNGCKEDEVVDTWEPPNVVKGDVARMMFYMATRYEGTQNEDTPDLELLDRDTEVGEPSFGRLCDLVSWHFKDPVSQAEKERNDVIYKWQGNRNPFIDHPEFVAPIWGGQCSLPAENVLALQDGATQEIDGAIMGLPRSISDGDTFKIGSTKFRLWGYDSPEKAQSCYDETADECVPCGIQARDALRGLIDGKPVACFDLGERTYGRTVAHCYVGNESINHWMVLNGHGVALSQYTKSWEGAEAIARSKNAGIWSLDFIDPYRWRQGKRLSQCD